MNSSSVCAASHTWSECGLTLLGIRGLGSFLQLMDALPSWASMTIILVLLALAILLPAMAVIVAAVSYTQAHLGLRRLVYTFAALVLLFANCY